MSFYKKDINEVFETLTKREIEILARLQISYFFGQGYRPEELKKELQELLALERTEKALDV